MKCAFINRSFHSYFSFRRHLASSNFGTCAPAQAPRFCVDQPLDNTRDGSLIQLPQQESKHALKTLRLKEDSYIELIDGRGNIGQAQLVSGAARKKDSAAARLIGPVERLHPPPWQWELVAACGSLKAGRGDWLVEKCVELGASSFTPLLTDRSPIMGSGNSGRGERWVRVANSASKQSLRAHEMKINPPCSVKELAERMKNVYAFIGVPGADPFIGQLSALTEAKGLGMVIIGPEGDFTEDELSTLSKYGARPAGLGPLRLRSETAALSMLVTAQMHCYSLQNVN